MKNHRRFGADVSTQFDRFLVMNDVAIDSIKFCFFCVLLLVVLLLSTLVQLFEKHTCLAAACCFFTFCL